MRKLAYGSYSYSIATMAVSLAVSPQCTNVTDIHSDTQPCRHRTTDGCNLISFIQPLPSPRESRPISAPIIPSRLWRFIDLLTYLLTYLQRATAALCSIARLHGASIMCVPAKAKKGKACGYVRCISNKLISRRDRRTLPLEPRHRCITLPPTTVTNFPVTFA